MQHNDQWYITESDDSDSKVQAAASLRRKSSGRGQNGEALGKLNIQPDPPSHASRSTRSQMDSPQHSLRVELNSPRKVHQSLKWKVASVFSKNELQFFFIPNEFGQRLDIFHVDYCK